MAVQFHRPSRINVPEFLQGLLKADADCESSTAQLLAAIEPLLKWSKLPFFPEYTDHGSDHIEAVLSTCVWLMTEQSKAIFTPQDATALVYACVLHDIAMHLDKAGLAKLIAKDSPWTPVDWFAEHRGDKPWHEEWQNFCEIARRFSAKENLRLYGTPEPVAPPTLDPINSQSKDWTDKQYLLVGEFVRRHHGRMAHEFALSGFPAANDIDVHAMVGSHKLADLVGLIARSHSLPLRECVDYLAQSPLHFKNRRDPHRVHAPYIMCLLRVADYLQVEPARAPQSVQHLRSRLRSPISSTEWSTHAAVEQIRVSDDDREAIRIDCDPHKCEIYLKLKNLLSGLQGELDQSWAVLGEIYSRVEDLELLGMKIRRIRSNLDHLPDVERQFGDLFVPLHARFKAADADLLKLLIGPLYSEDPHIGIRELVQNAIDAVRELNDLVSTDAVKSSDGPAVQVEYDGKELVVTDRGIGMTATTIHQYFLNAGASFRMSDIWKRQHEKNDANSQVFRSGRFGVGALAAFLIGNTLRVTTRHYNSTSGIEFQATIDSDPIELKPVKGVPIGTSITISVSPEAKEKFDAIFKGQHWPPASFISWYYLKEPHLRVNKIDGEGTLPTTSCEKLPKGWYRVTAEGYADIHWTYESRLISKHGTFAPPLFCNGIRIPDHILSEWDTAIFPRMTETPWPHPNEYLEDVVHQGTGEFPPPLISVFDNRGVFPLTLDRSALAEPLPFVENLAIDVIREWLAHALTCAKLGPGCSIEGLDHPILQYGGRNHPSYYWCSIGRAIFPKVAIGHLAEWPDVHVLDQFDTTFFCPPPLFDDTRLLRIASTSRPRRAEVQNWIRAVAGNTINYHRWRSGIIIIGKQWQKDEFIFQGIAWRYKQILVPHGAETSNAQAYTLGSPSERVLDIAAHYMSQATPSSLVAILGCPEEPKHHDRVESAVAHVWANTIREPIPMADFDIRGRVANSAADSLFPYLSGQVNLGPWWTVNPHKLFRF